MPDTFLLVDSDLGTFELRPGANVKYRAMTTVKPGGSAIVEPAGQAHTDLVTSTQGYLADDGIDVNLTDVQISGSHVMKTDGAPIASKVSMTIAGTTKLGGIPFTTRPGSEIVAASPFPLDPAPPV